MKLLTSIQSLSVAVLTGGPGCGKTTLLEMLGTSGLMTVPEAAMQLIEELNEKWGVEGQRAWRQQHFAEFQELLIDRQLALESSVDPEHWAVADRGFDAGVPVVAVPFMTVTERALFVTQSLRSFRRL